MQNTLIKWSLSRTGNRQAKAKSLIEASGLYMIAVEDFDKAAETVSTNKYKCKYLYYYLQVVNVSHIAELASRVNIGVDFVPL